MTVTDTILPDHRPPTHLGEVGSNLVSGLLKWFAGRFEWGTIELTESGVLTRLGQSGPIVTLRVHDPRFYGALARRGSIGLGESYIEGWWETNDLTTFIRILERGIDPLRAGLDAVARAIAPVRSPLSRRERLDKDKDRRDVQAHYDLSNEFYELMLDETMAYSCAYFSSPQTSLADASRAKLDLLCAKLALSPSDHVIEIGTGWASFAIHAAKHYGCRITTTTISDAQYEYASKRVDDEGVSDLVTILNRDYRDLNGTYDKLVSIEMIEAIGWRQLDTFFSTCSNLLRPNGLMGLQAIVINDGAYERAKHHVDLIKRLVFPGSFLPSTASMMQSIVTSTDLCLISSEEIGLHYAETLRRWRGNVAANREAIVRLGLGERFDRLWEIYLCYCEAAFRERHIRDVQWVLAKPEWGGPLSRGGFRARRAQ